MKFILFLTLIAFSFSNDSIRMAEYSRDIYKDSLWLLKKYKPEALGAMGEVQYMLDQDVIVVRGTTNVENVLEDLSYLKTRDLNHYVHKGFHRAGAEIYKKVFPKLKRNTPYYITGHSLGGAIAALIATHMHIDGFKVRCITFGQPMFINYSGAKEYDGKFFYLRYINHYDPVPLVPPLTLLASLHGRYSHFGTQIIMKDKGFDVERGREVVKHHTDYEFYEDLPKERVEYHFMDNYFKNLQRLSN